MRVSFVVAGVFWFLVAVAAVFAFLMVGSAVRAWRAREVQVVVVSRSLSLEVREVSAKRGTVKRIVLTSNVTLEDRVSGQRSTQTFERFLTSEEFTTHEFLDTYTSGSVKRASVAAHEPDRFDLEPDARWLIPVAFSLGVWMFGVFAWLVHPMIYDERLSEGVGLKILAMAALIVFASLFGAYSSGQWTPRSATPVERVPVEGFSKSLPTGEDLVALKTLKVAVKNEPALMEYVGDSIRFCQYQYGGKIWRTTSLYCQPSPDEPKPGRLNPANPWDVKWGDEN